MFSLLRPPDWPFATTSISTGLTIYYPPPKLLTINRWQRDYDGIFILVKDVAALDLFVTSLPRAVYSLLCKHHVLTRLSTKGLRETRGICLFAFCKLRLFLAVIMQGGLLMYAYFRWQSRSCWWVLPWFRDRKISKWAVLWLTCALTQFWADRSLSVLEDSRYETTLV